jgi:hypothetical protein
MVVLSLVHTPPAVDAVSDVVVPTIIEDTPLTKPVSGGETMVSGAVTVVAPQILATVYEIVVEPAREPYALPVASIVATGSLLVQVPPIVLSVNKTADPRHADPAPIIGETVGTALMAIACVTVVVPQPLDWEYDINAAPALNPATIPVEPTLTVTSLVVQVPPAVFIKLTVEPAQTDAGPLIGATVGNVATVIDCVTLVVPQLFDTA